MGEKLLNEGCTFKCSCCPAVVLKAQEIMNQKVKVEGKKALTTSSIMMVITPGFCPYSEIPPNPAGLNCVPRPINGRWEKASKHTIEGKNFIIESSEYVCLLSKAKGGNGRITVLKNPIKKSSQEIYVPPILVSSGIAAVNNDKSLDAKDDSVKENVKENNIDDKKEKSEKLKDNNDENAKEDVKEEDLYCPYDSTKDKCNNCRYVKAQDTHLLSEKVNSSNKTSAAILRSNYESDYTKLASTRKGYKNPCNSIEQEYGVFNEIGCGNQAHHILSVNDVFGQDRLKFVVKLANFYDYDINEAYNCIILPAYNARVDKKKNEYQAKFGEYSDFDKRASKYYAMRKSGRQWHGGGHNNDFENSHNISCYADEVTNRIYNSMKKENKNHCRIDEAYYEKDKKSFIEKLHRVLDLVRNHLILFEKNPQNSLPFYVSKDAYEYAFKSTNIRMLVFKKDDSRMMVYKFMFVRRGNKVSVDERGKKVFDVSKKIEKMMLVCFCEQIDVAYIDNSEGKVEIPFSINKTINVNMKNIELTDYFNNNISDVEAELIDCKEREESVLKRRLKEIKGE